METLDLFHKSISGCTNCILSKHRTQVVPWSGNPQASIMFIGEWPWKDEDIQGKPFVWRAGKFLNEMLNEIWLDRENVFIANTVKCRPPENRDPKPEEIKACLPYLRKQIEIIKPSIIVTLWRFALWLFFPDAKIWECHWKILTNRSLKVLCLYHPASALYNPNQKAIHKTDFQILKQFIWHSEKTA